MSEPPVLVDVRNGIATITLNRPKSLNAINPEMAVRLQAAYVRVRDDPAIRVAILAARGRAFCAGADLKRLITLINGDRQPSDDWDRAYLRTSPDPFMRTFDIKKPIIAAIQGYAVAGGMELVQGTDIRVASTAARFGLMEPARGLFPMGGSTVRLPRQIPKAIAMEILLTGKLMSAERMHAVGFVNHVAAPAQLMEVATSLANTIAANSPGALVAIKKSVRLCSGIALEQSMSVELAVGGPVFQQPDAVEGPRAFAEKRQPVWQPVGSGPEHSRSKL